MSVRPERDSPAPPTGFAELHDDLRAVARDLLGTAPGGAGAAAGKPAQPVDWASLAAAGWLGLEVPEEFGGAGATFAESAVVLTELGRAAARSSYLGTAVLAAAALLALAPSAERDALLRALAAGTPRYALGLATGDAPDLPFRLEPARGGEGFTLHGRAEFVPDAAEAEHLLLPARDPAGGQPVIVLLPPGRPGVDVTAVPVVDATRSLATITASAAAVAPWQVARFAGDDPGAAIAGLYARGALATACDSLGAAEAMLDATVAYAQVREQFGRPIGSFQAVKHACADLFVAVSVSRELIGAAVRTVAVNGPSLHPAGEVAVARAKSYVGAAAVDVAGTAMQLHGGIGYTWEAGIHVYLKRCVLGRALFGSPAAHRARLAEQFTGR